MKGRKEKMNQCSVIAERTQEEKIDAIIYKSPDSVVDQLI
jgi:hypothetical protein